MFAWLPRCGADLGYGRGVPCRFQCVRRRPGWVSAWLLLLTWGALGSEVRAQQGLAGRAADGAAEDVTEGIALSWVRLGGADTCVGGAALAVAVQERLALAEALFVSPEVAERLIEGHVARRGGSFVATLRVTDAAGAELGRRELSVEGDDCGALLRPLVFVLSLLVDSAQREARSADGVDGVESEVLSDLDASLAALPKRPRARSGETPGATDLRTTPAPAPPQQPGQTGQTGVSLGVRLSVAGEVGPLPGPSIAGALGLVLDLPRALRLIVEAGLTAGQEVSRDSGGGDGLVSLGLNPVWVGMLACPPESHRDGFAGTICATAALTRLSLTPTGPRGFRAQKSQAFLGHLGLRVGARRRWSRLSVWAELGFAVALRRDTLQFLQRSGALTSLYQPGPVNLGVHLGVERTF